MKRFTFLIYILLLGSFFFSYISVSHLHTFLNPSENHIKYTWKQTDTSLALFSGNVTLWRYNFNTQKGKPFFHPITINNTSITSLSPSDHPWHLGLWHSWKYINGVNYWEYNQTKGVQPWNYDGQTHIKRIAILKKKDFSCEFLLDIVYRQKGHKDILKEKRIVTVSSPNQNQSFHIDYHMTYTALDDRVTLDRTPLSNESNGDPLGGYAGLSLRFNTNLKSASFINTDHSTDLKHGMLADWTYYGLQNDRQEHIGVALFDHSKSFRYPSPWYIVQLKSIPLHYVGTAPLFQSSYTLKEDEQIEFKHRVQFYTEKPRFDNLEATSKKFK